MQHQHLVLLINAYTKANNAFTNYKWHNIWWDLTIGGGGTLRVLTIGGDEGGEIFLGQAVTNSLSGGITIDSYQNKLRIFEQGGCYEVCTLI
jgi:hypothetical protein